MINVFCSKCGNEISIEAEFCPVCGNKTGVQKNIVTETIEKVSDNEFVKSVKQDLGNSRSINMIKNKIDGATEKVKTASSEKKKKWKFRAITLAVVLAVVIIVFNTHECDECEDIYFGSENVINFWGETYAVCEDCYEDFYSW